MELSTKILSDITIFTKYARYRQDLGRRETWGEIVTRNKKMHQKKYPMLSDEIDDVYKLVYDKKVLPSMRSLQFSGKPIEVNPSRLFNCSALPIDHPDAFSEAMFLLLGGTGVGISVQKHHVEKLPEIRKPKPNRPYGTRRYLIGDSIEGWADAIKVLMRSYFEGTSDIRFDYSDIRPKGTLLITSGGKAPGSEPLKICLRQIKSILNEKEDGSKLIPIEVHDILCFIADAVLAGGIRRAALISLFSVNDEEMLSCKFGKWYEQNPQRARANNSAVLLRHKIKKNFFMDLWEKIKFSGSGEPGIYFTNDKEWICNPCNEVSLRSFQFCVSGDTKLITKNGIKNIKECVGKDVKIWNGKKWSNVKPYQTGVEDDLYRVFFSDGSYLDATANHKFLIKNRFEKSFREIETIDLINELEISKYGLQLPRPNIDYKGCGGRKIEYAYEYGFFLGDGHLDNKPKANLYNEDKKLPLRGNLFEKEYVNWNGTKYKTIEFPQLEESFCVKLKTKKGLPQILFSWNYNSILQFLAGWIDADGSQANKGARLYGREDLIRDAQLLCSKVGINSSVNLMQEAGVETNLGKRKNAVWYLQIPNASKIPSKRLNLLAGIEPINKGKNQLVKSIIKLEGKHGSFCLTEPDLHQCVFNNVLTKQCNLTEVNASDIESQEDLDERVKAASFIGTLQAGYTDFHYLRPIWKRTTEKDALLGIGMTGIGSGKVQQFDVEKAAELAIEENKRVAEKIEIRHAARLTCIKPAGTSSLVLGCSSGIHAWHNDYYIRRLRVGKNESIYQYLEKNHSELVEDDFFRPHDSAIISVPIKSPDGSITRHESALDLLERIKWFSKNWIEPGHISGNNSHNISATISIKDNEWGEVGEWMWQNREFYNGLSVLPYDGGSHVQQPFSDCSKEEYVKMMEFLREVDLTKIKEEQDDTDLSGEIACSGNSCEIKHI